MPPTEPIHHEIPMRWADLDQLNHVNNVVYLDYAAEARAALVEDGVVRSDDDIARMSVRFRRPMMLGTRPVVVSSQTDGEVLEQAIRIGRGETDPVFADVTTTYGTRQAAVARTDVESLPMQVRRSDLDAAGAVSATKVFELFQEARVKRISTDLAAMTPGSFVVGTSTATFRTPVRWRPAPHDVLAWVSRVGRSSFEVTCQLTDAGQVLVDSTTVLVGFDPGSQRSRPFGDDERAQLLDLVRD